jgi:hypothetical protein
MARLFEEICAKIGPPNNINSLGASTYLPTTALKHAVAYVGLEG